MTLLCHAFSESLAIILIRKTTINHEISGGSQGFVPPMFTPWHQEADARCIAEGHTFSCHHRGCFSKRLKHGAYPIATPKWIEHLLI